MATDSTGLPSNATTISSTSFTGAQRTPRIRPPHKFKSDWMKRNDLNDLASVYTDPFGMNATAPEEIENLPGIDKKILNTISPEIYYAYLTQPHRLSMFMKGEGVRNVELTRERRLFYLINCLLYYPKDLDVLFNIEVPPPYDYQTADFARHLVEVIGQRLADTGEIDEAEMPSIKEEIYKSRTYTIAQKVLERELADHQDYITYLMNVNDKVNITREEFALIDKITKKKKLLMKKLKDTHPTEYNSTIFGDFTDGNMINYIIAAPTPRIAYASGAMFVTMGIYLDNLFSDKFSIDRLRASYANVDIAMIGGILKKTRPGEVINFILEVFDQFGNAISVTLTDTTLNGMIVDLDNKLTKAMTQLSTGGKNLVDSIDQRLQKGALKI